MSDVIRKINSGNPVRIGSIVELATPKYSGDIQVRNNTQYVGVNEVARKGQTDITAVENKLTIRWDDASYYSA